MSGRTAEVTDLNADARFVRQDAGFDALAGMAVALAVYSPAVAQDHCVRMYRAGHITYGELEEIWDRVLDRLHNRMRVRPAGDPDGGPHAA